MKTYRIMPQETRDGQDVVTARHPSVRAAAADLRRLFPTRHGLEHVSIVQVDDQDGESGFFRLADGIQMA